MPYITLAHWIVDEDATKVVKEAFDISIIALQLFAYFIKDGHRNIFALVHFGKGI